MLQIILWVLLAAVIGFLAVIFVRAAMFSPKPEGKPSGEQVTVEYRIAQKLSAPVKKGSCAGAIYYKLGGMVLREYQVETTEDMEKLDFEWCLRQVLKLAV